MHEKDKKQNSSGTHSWIQSRLSHPNPLTIIITTTIIHLREWKACEYITFRGLCKEARALFLPRKSFLTQHITNNNSNNIIIILRYILTTNLYIYIYIIYIFIDSFKNR